MAKLQIIISPRARDDLKDISAYTLQTWGPKQTDVYLSNIQNAFIKLLSNPKIGRERPDVQPGLRSLTVEKHVIFYEFQDTKIHVLGVVHCRMDVLNHFVSE